MEQGLKTEFKREKDAKDLIIYKEWESLISQPEAMAGAVVRFLMKKHNLHATSTIWTIRKRVEKRLKSQNAPAR